MIMKLYYKLKKRRRVIPEAPEPNPVVHRDQLIELPPNATIEEVTAAWLKFYQAHMPKAVVRQQVAEGIGMDSDDLEGYVPPEIDYTPPVQSGGIPMGPQIPGNAQPNLPGTMVGFFLRNTFIGHQLSAMLAQHWLIGKCCWMPARDAVRKGFNFVDDDDSDNADIIRKLKTADKRYGLKRNLTQYVGFGKTFGIRVLIFKVESELEDYYEHPFNIDNVKPGTYRGMSQVDPYWCVPELDGTDLSKPENKHFYEPTWWVVNGQRYHRTHLAIYREGDVADILKPCYLYGGIPVPQKVIERVYAAERTANEAPELAMTKRTTTLKTDVAEMLAAGPASMAKLEYWTQFRNNYGVKLIGSDEELAQHDTSLSDFDALIMTQYQLVASAANVPATKLLGTSPKGFGASGEYEIESYHEELESIQEDQLTALIEHHHKLVLKSDILPQMPDVTDIPSIDIAWNPLDTPTTKELADTNYVKSQTALNYVNAGAIDGVDVRDAIIRDPDSGYAGIPGAYRPGEEADDDKVPAPSLAAQADPFY